MIAFNSGRGRGRPKKNAVGCRSHVEPTNTDFFRTIEKVGGPIEPTTGFSEIYTEIFIKKKAKPIHQDFNDDGEMNEDGEIEDDGEEGERHDDGEKQDEDEKGEENEDGEQDAEDNDEEKQEVEDSERPELESPDKKAQDPSAENESPTA